MNHIRIRFIIVSLFLAVAFLASPKSVLAASTEITISADKLDADPGEVINFTITLGPVTNMGTMQMVLDIPEGLTYVTNSGKLADGLRETLGFDYASFTEASKMINGVASRADYSSNTDTVLGYFSCTVDEGFKGTAKVALTDLEFASCRTWKEYTSEYTVLSAVIRVGVEETVAGQTEENNSSEQLAPTITDELNTTVSSEQQNVGGTGATQSAENKTESIQNENVPAENSMSQQSSDIAIITEAAGEDIEQTISGVSDEKTPVGAEQIDSNQNGSSEIKEGGEDATTFPGWLFAAIVVIVICALILIILLIKKHRSEDKNKWGR